MTPPIRYIDWDYDNHVAVEYERLGECNGCGACCFALIRFSISNQLDESQGGKRGGCSTDNKGVWTEVSRGNVRRYFMFHPVDTSIYSKCGMLTYDNKCLLHKKGKKLIQSGWPFSPKNVTPFPQCSYSFSEINRWAFE